MISRTLFLCILAEPKTGFMCIDFPIAIVTFEGGNRKVDSCATNPKLDDDDDEGGRGYHFNFNSSFIWREALPQRRCNSSWLCGGSEPRVAVDHRSAVYAYASFGALYSSSSSCASVITFRPLVTSSPAHARTHARTHKSSVCTEYCAAAAAATATATAWDSRSARTSKTVGDVYSGDSNNGVVVPI